MQPSKLLKLASIALLFSLPLIATMAAQSRADGTATVHVDATPGHAINSFDPDSALGSSMDVLSRDGIDKVYTPHIMQESLSAGWGPITYRNNTELRMAAWHWTENGTGAIRSTSGYFTGSTELKEPMRYILAYALPHRGFSTSGDRPFLGPNLSYWKSNPYLTSKFTGESDCVASAVGDCRSEGREAVERDSHCLGESLRHDVSGGVLGRQRTLSTSTAARKANGRCFSSGTQKTRAGGHGYSQARRCTSLDSILCAS